MAIKINGKKVAGVGSPGKSAYKAAQDGGYTGSEQEFNEDLAGLIDGPFIPQPSGGTEGQVLTKTTDGEAWQDAPNGLPDGGTEGQILYRTENGTEWGDKPVMYVNITESGGAYSADKTFAEIESAVENGYSVVANVISLGSSTILSLSQIVPGYAYFTLYLDGHVYFVIISTSESGDSVSYMETPVPASSISFSPTDTLTSDNVQDAIEEVDGKASSIGTDQIQDGSVTADKIGFTGEDIPTSSTDETSISSQLSNLAGNKADASKAFVDRTDFIYGSILEAALTKQPGTYIVDISATDTPIQGIWYFAKIYDVSITHRIVELYSGANSGYQEKYYTTYNSASEPGWDGWSKITTAMSPQEFDLPLASGFSNGGGGNSVYWKDQFNQVHFLVSVTNQNSLSSGDVIATLPAGFRPSKTAIFVLGSLLSAVKKTGSLNVKSDGSIVYFGDPLSSGAVVFGTGVFVAAS